MKVENSVNNRNIMVPVKTALSRFVKAEMAKKGFKYKDLQEKIRSQNIELSEANLRGKINKGLIPADLLIMILIALDVEVLNVSDLMKLTASVED